MTTKFVPGKYIVIADELNIRPQMDRTNKPIGMYFNGDVIDIYKVFPEVILNGESQIWGLNSQNENPPTRYVCMKLNLTHKVVLKAPYLSMPEPEPEQPVTRAEFDHLVKWAMVQGYKKP